jgi:propionate CoA-transferase
MEIDGEEYLFYKAFPIHVGIIRGTTADPDGNITMEKEALTLEAQAIAMAARNSGGIVIAQVERIAERGTLNPRQVKIPGVLVDCVVVAEKPEYHMQTFIEQYSPAFSGEIKVPMSAIAPMPMSERKIIARRAALELKANAVVNLGIGMPEGVANVAAEEQIIDLMTLTAEPGVIGGVPAGGLSFGAATNAQAIIDQPSQFDFYDGGGLDIAFLGLAQADRRATSTSPSSARGWPAPAASSTFRRTPRRWSSSAPSRPATWRWRSTTASWHPGGRPGGQVRRGGRAPHLQRPAAARRGKQVLYITERCVFRLTADGLELTEIAPGVDLQKDILDKMDFRPIIHGQPALMDARIFADEPMGIRAELLESRSPSVSATTRRRTCSSSTSPASRCAAPPTSGIAAASSGARPDRPQGQRHRQLRPLQHRARADRRLHRDGQGHHGAPLPRRDALHRQHLPAHEAGRGAGQAPDGTENQPKRGRCPAAVNREPMTAGTSGKRRFKPDWERGFR